MLTALWHLSAAIRGYLRFYMPTNRAVDWLRTPRGLKWAIPVALVATPAYLGLTALAIERPPARSRLAQRAGVPLLLERHEVRLDGGAVASPAGSLVAGRRVVGCFRQAPSPGQPVPFAHRATDSPGHL